MGTTAQKLSKLQTTKNAIKQAIIDKGVAGVTDNFSTYPAKIAEIQSGGSQNYFSTTSVVVAGTTTSSGLDKLILTVPKDLKIGTTMNYMFAGCSNLATIPAFDTSNVTSMSYMFRYCTGLKSILMYGMKAAFEISSSTKFERSDLVTILNNLGTVTSSKTLTMGSTNLAKLTSEDKAIATNKGWSLY